MNRYRLQTSVEINGVECEFNSDFRDILDIFIVFNDPNLLDQEKVLIALYKFYKTEDFKADIELAVTTMMDFINMGDNETKASGISKKPLYDWEQDFNIIISPINRILNTDVRREEYLHWWTFLSAFIEIGECTFSTYVGIREKLNKGKRLEKYEEKILRDNRDKVILKPKVDDTTQSILDEIMGV